MWNCEMWNVKCPQTTKLFVFMWICHILNSVSLKYAFFCKFVRLTSEKVLITQAEKLKFLSSSSLRKFWNIYGPFLAHLDDSNVRNNQQNQANNLYSYCIG